ncbi:MAG: hypothetical protein LBR26_09825 [Prevotella sp.]|jgi:hypothetical protein|nr:hypothetical protein [Prevotella sp.]
MEANRIEENLFETLFENEYVKLYTRKNDSCNSKRFRLIVKKAKHPFDGMEYEKPGGWISTTMCLHTVASCPEYAIEEAIRIMNEYGNEIFESICKLLEKENQIYKLELFQTGNARNLGLTC